ncbi:FtsQ-type POTRA domain-containing protein [bacterium]|nr:FtsQ-type POTRA domain-containing protein [bacterium]
MAFVNKMKIFFLRVFTVMLFYIFLLFFTALFVFSVHAYIAFKHSDSMTIEPGTVEVDGNHMISRNDVLLLAALDVPISYMDLSSEKVERDISTHPWVKEALVMTLPPDSVKIIIEEYEPKVLVNNRGKDGKNTLWFADKDGYIFKQLISTEKEITELPLVMINSGFTSEQKSAIILTALSLIERWNSDDALCIIKSVHFSLVGGFSADCSSGDGLTAELRLGTLLEKDEKKVLDTLYGKFTKIFSYYYGKNQWVGEYIFYKKSERYHIIVGKIKEVVSDVEK